ncbi:hypothetical protein RD792_011614 [Penstemon davidsonii]|uniref:FIST C-domain domain-containing protein n=1 Tax=Penstemon davidsonii TaxID=160366 RepID=A0ABR0CVH1_9LAMI|nr:hypothetical protein RD792_011614 [Penstemon davidsonii]
MEHRSIQSPEKMAKKSSEETQTTVNKGIIVGIDDLGEDLMRNILSRLPALSFASAACVSRYWNFLCNLVLSYPKLSSAASFSSSLENALSEAVDKVLSEPIRPHFVIASIGPAFSLQRAHQLIAEKLGSRIPLIINVSAGIIGRDLFTDKFVEVQWEVTEEDEGYEFAEENASRGLILTVGFLPGLMTHIVPLLSEDMGPLLVDEFVADIQGYASAVSDSESPAGIMLFADLKTDIKPVLQAMEYAFSRDTVIVGDGGSRFLYRSGSINTTNGMPKSAPAAVALLFARDRNKPIGIGEINFHAMLSTGLSPVGLTYKAVSVKSYASSTCVTASRNTLHEHLDGITILEEVYDQLGDRIQYPSFFIGVTKRRKCCVGMGKIRRMQFLEFHEVLGGNEEYLFLNSVGIKTGDPFQFYMSNSKSAMAYCKTISDNLRLLKLGCEHRPDQASSSVSYLDKSEVFGGIIFSCCGRGDSFFGQSGVDSSPFLDNFPGVTFAGTYCNGEIGRSNSSLYNKEDGFSSCCVHVYSAAYLVMSYSPPSLP